MSIHFRPRLNNACLNTLTLLCLTQFVSAQQGDGGAATGNIQGSAFNNGEQAASQGPSTSSANLSVGATVAIAVVVGVVVILGTIMAFLFFTAKRRQWTIRETLRHSRKRVTTGLKTIASPLTPHRGTFTPIKTKFSKRDAAGFRGDQVPTIVEESHTGRGRDLEKGQGADATVFTSDSRSASRSARKDRLQPMKLAIPSKNNSPSESPQTPMWSKFLGRT